MDDHSEDEPPRPAGDAVQNSITGSPSTAIQLRDLHNGNIYINSQVFVNADPSQSSPAGELTEPTCPANADPHSLHVLAVDDDHEALDGLVRALRDDPRIGSVGAAADAAEALRYVQTTQQHGHPLDAWFLDVSMPGLSGLDLAGVGTIFAQPPSVVFVTASETHAVAAFGLEAVDYLVKPVLPDRLNQTISRLTRHPQTASGQSHSGGANCSR